MKWVAFIVVMAGIAPLSGWLRRNPSRALQVWMLAGFLPFILANLHLYFAIDSWADWPGYVKGAEFSVLDALAIAFYFTLPKSRESLPFLLSMGFYIFAVLVSAMQAKIPMAALFCVWQLARMVLVYAVVSRACADPRVPTAILSGMAIALIMQAVVALWQRFGLGILQASGTTSHQNTLGLISHMVVFPCFALVLAGHRSRLFLLAVFAGIIVEVLTGSRATLGLAGLGYAAVFMFSALRQWTGRKAQFLVIALAAVAILAPVGYSSIEHRGAASLESSDHERSALEVAAAAMLADHPWGVGANQFVLAANTGGYYQRAGVSWTSYAAFVHNTYWLTAVETGYFGLFAFVLYLMRPMLVAFRCGWRSRRDVRGDLLIGLGVALLIVYLHAAFEWIFLTFEPQYIYAMDLGLVAGLAQQLGYWRRRVPLGFNAPPIVTAENTSYVPTGLRSWARFQPQRFVGKTVDQVRR